MVPANKVPAETVSLGAVPAEAVAVTAVTAKEVPAAVPQTVLEDVAALLKEPSPL